MGIYANRKSRTIVEKGWKLNLLEFNKLKPFYEK